MDLQELRLIEASAINITFKQNSLVKGKGSIKVDYGTVEFVADIWLINLRPVFLLCVPAHVYAVFKVIKSILMVKKSFFYR